MVASRTERTTHWASHVSHKHHLTLADNLTFHSVFLTLYIVAIAGTMALSNRAFRWGELSRRGAVVVLIKLVVILLSRPMFNRLATPAPWDFRPSVHWTIKQIVFPSVRSTSGTAL